MEHKPTPESPIEIELHQLSDEIATSLIEHFVLREGTDYGWVEVTLEKKIEQIRRQIEKGEIKIVFDQSTESVTLLPARR